MLQLLLHPLPFRHMLQEVLGEAQLHARCLAEAQHHEALVVGAHVVLGSAVGSQIVVRGEKQFMLARLERRAPP